MLRRSCVLGQVGRSFEYFNSAVDFSPEKTRCTGAGDGEEGAGRDMGAAPVSSCDGAGAATRVRPTSRADQRLAGPTSGADEQGRRAGRGASRCDGCSSGPPVLTGTVGESALRRCADARGGSCTLESVAV